ncbi:MAG TPA: hypothetical protein VMU85_18775 [Stellaceae bacterium]|nr:hypothetical protein [Stellaceae bacterium]
MAAAVASRGGISIGSRGSVAIGSRDLGGAEARLGGTVPVSRASVGAGAGFAGIAIAAGGAGGSAGRSATGVPMTGGSGVGAAAGTPRLGAEVRRTDGMRTGRSGASVGAVGLSVVSRRGRMGGGGFAGCAARCSLLRVDAGKTRQSAGVGRAGLACGAVFSASEGSEDGTLSQGSFRFTMRPSRPS